MHVCNLKAINQINNICHRCDQPLNVRAAIVTLVIEIYYKSRSGRRGLQLPMQSVHINSWRKSVWNNHIYTVS